MLGPHAAFIVGAYAAAALVIGALIGWVMLDGRRQRRELGRFEESGGPRLRVAADRT